VNALKAKLTNKYIHKFAMTQCLRFSRLQACAASNQTPTNGLAVMNQPMATKVAGLDFLGLDYEFSCNIPSVYFVQQH
jgi:hypothetical protein